MSLYRYRAEVTRVVDGDTVDVTVDLGFGIHHDMRLRLAGIDAPEPRGETKAEGLNAAAQLEYFLTHEEGHSEYVTIETRKSGKYGRWLAWLYLEGDEQSINHKMVLAGHATLTEE